METKTHWKKLHNPDYLGAYSLMETGTPIDMVVKIKAVVLKGIKGEDGKDQDCMIAELVNQKPMVINATNAKTLTKLFGSPFIEDWAGKSFTLFVAKVRAFGDTLDALRIRPTLPKLPEFTPAHPKWEAAMKSTDPNKLDSIRANYSISDENVKLLMGSI